jgi:DoxX-like family
MQTKVTRRRTQVALNGFIAIIWMINGLFCKVLNLVPRHQQIVARIMGDEYSRPLTIVIGFMEVAMAIWVLSRVRQRVSAIIQIGVVAVMNVLEFILVPDLLLWGKGNAIFAFVFVLLIAYNGYCLDKEIQRS